MNEFAQCRTADGEALNFEGVSAKGVVNGSLLEMTLEQRFRNPEECNVEVVYTFPLPWGAVLLGIEVLLNGQKLSGKVTARQAARETYETALSEGNTSILLAKNSDGSYTLELGNLLAQEACVIVLKYAQQLQPEQGHLRLTLPTTIAPRYGNAVRNGKFEPHAAPLTDALVEYPFEIAFEVHGPFGHAGVSSPTHQIGVRHRDDALHVSLGRSSWLDRDFTLVFTDLQQLSQAITATDHLEPGTSVVMASFAPNLGHLATAANSAVALKLLVDCSGSMGGDSIQAARSALQGIVASLISADRFSLSRFGSSVEHRCKALWTGAPAAKASAMQRYAKLRITLPMRSSQLCAYAAGRRHRH